MFPKKVNLLFLLVERNEKDLHENNACNKNVHHRLCILGQRSYVKMNKIGCLRITVEPFIIMGAQFSCICRYPYLTNFKPQ